MARPKPTPEEKKQRNDENRRRWFAAHPGKKREAFVKWVKSPQGRTYSREYRERPAARIGIMMTDAKFRAKQRGFEFDENLRTTWVAKPPMKCCCCGVDFDYSLGTGRAKRRAPTLDRLDNGKGYTIENARIICYHCNSVKSDATLAELEAVVAYMRAELLPWTP